VPENPPPHDTYTSLVRGWEQWAQEHPAASEGQEIPDRDFPRVLAFDRFINPPALRRVLLQMLNPDPARRISIAGVVSNRWVKNIECCSSDSFDDPPPGSMIDASKKPTLNRSVNGKKIYCHNHMPPKDIHALGKMPK
jgi:protein-serine/threonine kinase